jgi:hypothetical protein
MMSSPIGPVEAINPFSTELTISRTYGFAPATALPLPLPILPALINPDLANVTRAPAVSPVVRWEKPPEHEVDRYA